MHGGHWGLLGPFPQEGPEVPQLLWRLQEAEKRHQLERSGLEVSLEFPKTWNFTQIQQSWRRILPKFWNFRGNFVQILEF